MQLFETYLSDYLSAIREAKEKGASHDYLRQVFIEFSRKRFKVDPVDVELEKGIKGATLRGSIDALYQDIVFEFKRDLKIERDKGREELERYLVLSAISKSSSACLPMASSLKPIFFRMMVWQR